MSPVNLEKIAASKLWLISAPLAAATAGSDSPRDLPYLAHALYALIPVISREVERATCDERWRIYLNPDWLDGASVPEIGRELAHLTWHLLGDHAARALDLDVDTSTADEWNRAADAALSHVLEPDGVRPPDLATASDLGARPGLSAEEYFAVLSGLPVTSRSGDPDEGGGDGGSGELTPGNGCGSGADGIPRSHEHDDGPEFGSVTAADAHEIRRSVALDYQSRPGQRGTEPGEALRWIRSTADPIVRWEALLTIAVRRAIGTAAGRGEYTFSRPSRRSSSVPGFTLPGQRRHVPRLSVVVDTSASVDDELLARALGELDGAIAALGFAGAQVTVYSVDAAVHTIQRVARALDARLVGAGGTDLRIGLRAVEAERPRPDVVIVFTDGDTPWPVTPPPGARVIVAILGRRRELLSPTPPWAIRVECVLDD